MLKCSITLLHPKCRCGALAERDLKSREAKTSYRFSRVTGIKKQRRFRGIARFYVLVFFISSLPIAVQSPPPVRSTPQNQSYSGIDVAPFSTTMHSGTQSLPKCLMA